MALRFAIVFALTLGCVGCGAHDATDPEYGQMFKQATHDRVAGTQFWGSGRQKDCTATGTIEVCTPKTD